MMPLFLGMPNRENLKPSLIQSLSPDEFVKKSLEVFQFQHAHVPVYRSYCDHLKVKIKNVTALEDIPFLPIELFKSHEVSVEKVPFEKVFFLKIALSMTVPSLLQIIS